MTPWQEYKKKLGDTRPWDMVNSNVPRVEEQVSERRMSICSDCPEFIGLTKQCKQCGCIMPMKVKLEAAKCPLGKW